MRRARAIQRAPAVLVSGMKRILYTSWYTGLGGGETDLLTLAGALDSNRYEPQLLLPADGKLSKRWRAAGWGAHDLPYRGASTWFVPALWARFPVARRMQDLLAEQQIDLAHCDYHTLPFIAAAARRLDLPVLWTVWGWWFKPKAWQRAFFRSLPAVARSRAIRDGFLGSPPFMPSEQLPVIYAGVDSERFRPGLDRDLRREMGIADDALVVAMVARFQPVKGHHIFQALAEKVLTALPRTRFIVAGDDVFGVAADQRYRKNILERAAEHPTLRDSLQYIGFRADIEAVYAAADVYVCASDFESYGIANLEAMACGLPVVSTRRGGPAETILHGETGYLVDAGDVDALADGVLRLLRDAGLRARMGAAGRRRLRESFSIAAAADAHMRLYDRLLR
ncbi:MAG: glycosyltransferase family 4 protein [Chloroflexi bacterium]|nr:glycosyltransferase family 4 protein [Chloroflexota bacterium]MYH66971.1 glycosyltransferase family 4 protein [Chloroflexota bacterium]